jgi:phage terminase large subunit GpA-like protein
MEPTPEPPVCKVCDQPIQYESGPGVWVHTEPQSPVRAHFATPPDSDSDGQWRLVPIIAVPEEIHEAMLHRAETAERELEQLRVDYSILWRLTLGRTGESTADDATLQALAERAEELLKLSVPDERMSP